MWVRHLALVSGLLIGSVATAQTADLMITRGRLFGADAAADTLAIAGDKIIAVGTQADLAKLQGAQTQRIDAGGARSPPVSTMHTCIFFPVVCHSRKSI